MTEYAATTTAVRLKFEALDDFEAHVTGVTDLYAIVWRDSDDFIFDWSDNAFKTPASVVTTQGVLAEINATYLPGWYARTLPVQPGGTYTVIYGQVGSTIANLVGAHDEIIIGRLAVPGDAMDLVADAVDATSVAASAVTELQSGLATASAIASAQTDIDDIQARLPAALVSGRIDASVGAMAADVLTASAVATDAVAELQAGLATAAALAALPAAVWAVPEGTGTYGASLALIRKFQTNPMWADTTGGGRYRLWDDDLETVILTVQLRDGDGNAITTQAGSPARRGTPVL
jgi:hypothetical protein